MPNLITRIAAWFLGPAATSISLRRYSGAAHTRTTFGFGTSGNASADTELAGQLSVLRARSRQLVRDNAYAKRAKAIVQNNVVGAGVGLQAQVMTTRNTLATTVNDGIEAAWKRWCHADACHTGGSLHFSDLERVAMGEVFEAGEILIRKHYRTFGRSRVPVALELIEAERLLDDTHAPFAGVLNGNVRMGVELDEFQRPVAYYLRRKHPGDRRWQGNMPDEVIRVPASEMFHLRLPGRWPQTRGEPWMHTVVRKLDDIGEYTASEVQAARASSYYFGTIESPESVNPLATDLNDGTMGPSVDIEPGQIQQLMPGEKLQFHTPTRPNAALDPFLRYMLREVAAGVGVSYESLSRDYSQSNYSSSRLALLDDRDMWRVLQQWWIRAFREPLHAEWLQAAVMARAIAEVPLDAYLADADRYQRVKWKPRGWSWVDPSKEQDAYAAAVRNGFMTVTDVIAQTSGGLDIEDVIDTRRRELDALAAAGIKVDTTVEDEPEPAPPPPAEPEDRSVHVNVSPAIHVPERSITVEGARVDVPAPQVHMRSPNVHVEAPVINVASPDVRVEPAVVNVAPAAVVVNPPVINVEAPQVRVDTPAPVINVAPEVHVEPTPVSVAAPNVTVMHEAHDTEQTVETDARGNVRRVVTRRIRKG